VSYNPTATTDLTANPQPFFATTVGGESHDRDNRRAAARELNVWLSALPSFLVLKNHPLSDAEKSCLTERNYIHETRILKQVLRRCLHLYLVLSSDPRDDQSATHDETLRASSSFDGESASQPMILFAGVRESLAEIYGASCALAQAKKIDQDAWSGLCGLLSRALRSKESRVDGARSAPGEILRQRLPDVHTLIESVAPTVQVKDVTVVLSLFACSLDHLGFVGAWLDDDRPLKTTLPVFAHVHDSAREAVATLERMARRATEERSEWYELCDGAGYAVGMELNKVFRHELVGLAASRHPSTIFTKVENSHGLLRECFQQTILSLVRALDPAFDGEKLFDTMHAKLRQSLLLRQELWALSESVRRAERDGDRKPLAPLVARLRAFQTGAMRHLMYKDWESFERFVAEVTAARGAVELVPVLHRFATYLDALFNQINMRAVLADHSFDFHPIAD
jgi:hypothetical protein